MAKKRIAPAKPRISAEKLEQARENPYSEAVLAHDHIICLECGAIYRSLNKHLVADHQIDTDAYRIRWGYTLGQGLMAGYMLDNLRQHALKRGQGQIGKANLRPGKPVVGQIKWSRQARLSQSAALTGKRQPTMSRQNRLDVTVVQVFELYEKGVSAKEIAQSLSCSQALVRKRLMEKGIHYTRRLFIEPSELEKAREEGLSYAEMRARFGCGQTCLYSNIKAAGIPTRKMSPSIKSSTVLELAESGLTDKEIAVRLGWPTAKVRRVRKEARTKTQA